MKKIIIVFVSIVICILVILALVPQFTMGHGGGMLAQDCSNMRAIWCSVVAYNNECNSWCIDKDQLVKWSEGDINEKLFVSRRGKFDDVPMPHYIFVPENFEKKERSMVMISSPLLRYSKNTVIIIYNDGSHEYVQ